ncbi:MAG: NAD-dependent epimerase/dehydratase family protein [Propionibacteriaceae bacterium]|nr:NAD-dependent epimerase/dehydratase family protein [Propionibacteriaceae bacterium]
MGLPLDWSSLSGKTVLVTGASGMIGSFLIDVLVAVGRARGVECRAIGLARDEARLRRRFGVAAGADDTALRLVGMDVTKPWPDALPPADFVIHAASNTHPVAYATDPVGTVMTNVQGTLNALGYAVRSHATRACFVSTVEIYGDGRPGQRPFAEADLGYLDCNTVRAGYPEGKRVGESLCQAFRSQHGIECVIPRLPRVLGPTVLPDDSKASSQFIAKAVAGEDIVLKSPGEQHYSYLYVADAVAGLLTCLLAGQDGQAYNVADPGWDLHLRELAQAAAEVAGTRVIFDLPDEVERRGFSAATTALLDGTKLAGLGWAPLFDVPTALAHTVAILKESDSHGV